MKAFIYHTGRGDTGKDTETREFKTLDELLQFTLQAKKDFDADGIILFPPYKDDEWSIEIYDDYRE